MMNTVTKEFIVENERGLHARPSASFVKKTLEFQSDVFIISDVGKVVNGKSIMDLLTLGAPKGCKLTVTAKGVDATEVISAIDKLFETRFGEN